MKVILELLGDTGRVLEGVEGLSDFRPESRDRVRELLKTLKLESERILATDVSEGKEDDSREVFFHRALEAISTRKYEVARGILEDAVNRHAEDFEFWNYLGLVAWEQEDMKTAQDAYHRAVAVAIGEELDPERVDGAGDPALRAVEGRALALYRMGELERALEDFVWLGENFSAQYVGCRYLAGEIHHHQGRIDEAIALYEKVPLEPAVLYNLGLACFEAHMLDRASRTLIQAFVANVHIGASLLGRYRAMKGCTPGYLGSRAYAEEFVEACRRLWHRSPGSLTFLEGCFDHELVRHHIERCGEHGGTRLLQSGEGALGCSGWLDQLQDEQTLKSLSTKVLQRLRV